jgi:transcription initiation factor IIE alpha subunit
MTLSWLLYLVYSTSATADLKACDRLHAEDLAHLLGMQPKELRKLCARLREDRLVAVYVPQRWWFDMHSK